MLIYRSNTGVVAPGRALLAELTDATTSAAASAHPQHDRVVSLLIDAGMLESAAADALSDQCERAVPPAIVLHRVTHAIAHALVASWDGNERGCREWLAHAAAHATQVDAASLPERITYRAPEGYAFYGLYPESYVEAARQVWADRRPGRALSIGIRSIGSSLAAVAAAALEQRGAVVTSWTVRPVGHPFDRRVCISPELRAMLLAHPVDLALVVDEGPGLSGSSFAAAAEALEEMGIARDRIVLLPAWLPDGQAFVSDRARNAWRDHQKAHVPFERTWLDSGKLSAAFAADSLEDLSAGAWRLRWMAGSEAGWPPIQPQHERRKYLARSRAGHRRLLKFAGLGRFGQQVLARAHALHGTPAALDHLELSSGFLARPEVKGNPLSRRDTANMFVIADYLADIGRRFRTGVAADMSSVTEMTLVNAEELLGGAAIPNLRALAAEAAQWTDVPAVLLDNRMFPHEWLSTDRGLVKVDALEHHDDHFYPGPHDLAWDVAATLVEFELSGDAADALTSRIASALADSHLAERIRFFSAAYVAFRAAYCTMGANALGEHPDADRLRAGAGRYTESLRSKS